LNLKDLKPKNNSDKRKANKIEGLKPPDFNPNLKTYLQNSIAKNNFN